MYVNFFGRSAEHKIIQRSTRISDLTSGIVIASAQFASVYCIFLFDRIFSRLEPICTETKRLSLLQVPLPNRSYLQFEPIHTIMPKQKKKITSVRYKKKTVT